MNSRRLFSALALLAGAAFAQPDAKVQCSAVSVCSVTLPNAGLVLVRMWGQALPGTITSVPALVWTSRRNQSTYHSNDRVFSALAPAGVLAVTSTRIEENMAIGAWAGYDDSLVGSDSYPGGMQSNRCPVSGVPLTVTPTADALIVTTWVMDAGHSNTCTGSSGSPITPGTCPATANVLGQWNFQTAAGGTPVSQLWTLDPVWNGGNENCGMLAFSKTPPPPPPPPPPPSTTDRATLVSLLNLAAGPGMAILDNGVQALISMQDLSPHCIPQPTGPIWTITQAQHRRTDDGIAVIIYDDKIPRHTVNAGGWTVDPATLTVTIAFAEPQAGCVVIR